MADFIRETKNGVLIDIRVVPGASKEEISYDKEYKQLRVRISRLAMRGKANKAVLRLLSKVVGDCEIVSGKTSRKKTILIKNRNAADIKQCLFIR
ncbi:MAG TPA: YggU family protein [Candidatus Altiarchaeales archaeon]|nr:YggU family protein [Candidatus Altiarchaeales archaeon]